MVAGDTQLALAYRDGVDRLVAGETLGRHGLEGQALRLVIVREYLIANFQRLDCLNAFRRAGGVLCRRRAT